MLVPARRCSELATAIAVEDVDVFVLQHQRGLITWSSLAWLLQDPRLRNRHVIVTLHGAGTIQELNSDEQKTVVTALQSAFAGCRSYRSLT